MRISDWSSDVCSSDLRGLGGEPAAHIDAGAGPGADQHRGADVDQQQLLHLAALSDGGFGFILAHGSTLSVQAKRPRRSAAPALPSISVRGWAPSAVSIRWAGACAEARRWSCESRPVSFGVQVTSVPATRTPC